MFKDFPAFLNLLVENFAFDKPSEVVEQVLTILKYFMINSESFAQIENILISKLDDLTYLLLHKSIELRELSLELICFLSEQKMSTRFLISKHPKLIEKIIGTICQN